VIIYFVYFEDSAGKRYFTGKDELGAYLLSSDKSLAHRFLTPEQAEEIASSPYFRTQFKIEANK
jgi:hypothetical protein